MSPRCTPIQVRARVRAVATATNYIVVTFASSCAVYLSPSPLHAGERAIKSPTCEWRLNERITDITPAYDGASIPTPVRVVANKYLYHVDGFTRARCSLASFTVAMGTRRNRTVASRGQIRVGHFLESMTGRFHEMAYQVWALDARVARARWF